MIRWLVIALLVSWAVVVGLAIAGCEHDPVAGPEARTRPIVASVNSDVYHRPGCRYVTRIADHNLRGYNGAAHAERHGLRPCKVCEPGERSER